MKNLYEFTHDSDQLAEERSLNLCPRVTICFDLEWPEYNYAEISDFRVFEEDGTEIKELSAKLEDEITKAIERHIDHYFSELMEDHAASDPRNEPEYWEDR